MNDIAFVDEIVQAFSERINRDHDPVQMLVHLSHNGTVPWNLYRDLQADGTGVWEGEQGLWALGRLRMNPANNKRFKGLNHFVKSTVLVALKAFCRSRKRTIIVCLDPTFPLEEILADLWHVDRISPTFFIARQDR
jgi:hypothetical protein